MATDHNVPVHIQIQEMLSQSIKAGIYKAGDRLPSEAELANQFSTTRATVVDAMNGLLCDGLIERVRGRGTFVAKPVIVTTVDTQVLSFFERDMINNGKSVSYRVLNFTKVPTNQQIREQLAIGKRDPVHQLLRQRLVDDQPIAIEIRYLPSLSALRMHVKQLETLPLQTIFQDILGMTITTIDNQVRVGLASKDVAEWLEIKRNRPVMIRSHTYFNENKKPLLWGETIYREEYEIHYTSQQSNLNCKLK